jgi:hypothetical protein
MRRHFRVLVLLIAVLGFDGVRGCGHHIRNPEPAAAKETPQRSEDFYNLH